MVMSTSLFSSSFRVNTRLAEHERAYHADIRAHLVSCLRHAIKAVIRTCPPHSQQPVQHCRASEQLCTTLEAVFVHGLRDSLVDFMSDAFDTARQPQPSFWSVALLVSDAHIVERINQLSQIHTDIGRCRCWIRMLFNENKLSECLRTLTRLESDNTLNTHYKRVAILRDSETSDIIARCLVSLENHTFLLPVDCTLLNTWPPQSLQLCGVLRHVRTKHSSRGSRKSRSHPATTTRTERVTVTTCDGVCSEAEDIASSLPTTARSHTEDSVPQLIDGTYDPDMALRVIMQGGVIKEGDAFISVSERESRCTLSGRSVAGDTVSSYTSVTTLDSGSSTRRSAATVESECSSNSSSSLASEMSALNRRLMSRESYISALDLYRKSFAEPTVPRTGAKDDDDKDGCGSGRAPDAETVEQAVCEVGRLFTVREKQTLEESAGVPLEAEAEAGSTAPQDDDVTVASGDSDRNVEAAYRVENVAPVLSQAVSSVTQHSVVTYSMTPCTQQDREQQQQEEEEEAVTATIPLTTLCSPRGLDEQEYRCNDCARFVGMLYGVARICALDGAYYCTECHDGCASAIIPARVLHNWDFSYYMVSRRAVERLRHEAHTLFHLDHVCPSLYQFKHGLRHVRDLRRRLIYLYAFVKTCRHNNIAHTIECELHEHMYSQTHTYTVSDLVLLRDGQLHKPIAARVRQCRRHVLACEVCRVRGFYCRLCAGCRSHKRVVSTEHVPAEFPVGSSEVISDDSGGTDQSEAQKSVEAQNTEKSSPTHQGASNHDNKKSVSTHGRLRLHDEQIIYPFDIRHTSVCDLCSTVYHRKCWLARTYCPGCLRKAAQSQPTTPEQLNQSDD